MIGLGKDRFRIYQANAAYLIAQASARLEILITFPKLAATEAVVDLLNKATAKFGTSATGNARVLLSLASQRLQDLHDLRRIDP